MIMVNHLQQDMNEMKLCVYTQNPKTPEGMQILYSYAICNTIILRTTTYMLTHITIYLFLEQTKAVGYDSICLTKNK